MQESKEKITIWMTRNQKKELLNYLELSPENNMTAYIIKAIEFYGDYLQGKENLYLPLALNSALKGNLQLTEDRLSSLLFKNAVELDMIMNILGATAEIDETTLKKLRRKCIEDVKITRGRIVFEDVYKYQKG